MNHDEMKREIVGMYNRASDLYGQVGTRRLPYFGSLLIDMLHIPVGSYILDIACGRGDMLLAVAEEVGDSGQVIGIDLASGMLSHAKARLLQFNQAKVVMMDGDHLAFRKSSFDFITCGFALHFLNYEDVLAQAIRLLKPGGCFAAIVPFVPQDEENMARWGWLFTLTKTVFPVDFTPPPAWTAPNRLNKQEAAQTALRQAGFESVETQKQVVNGYFRDENDWWDWEWSQAPRFWLEGMSSEGLAHFKQEAFHNLAAMKGENGIPIREGALFIIGYKANE